MRFLAKLAFGICIVSFFLMMLANPKGAANLLVNLGESAAWAASQIGEFCLWLSKRLAEARS